MTYLVFDCRKATGYLFETRRRWLAQAFCIVAYWLGAGHWDWSATMDFTAWNPTEAELDWRETYGA